MGNTEALPENDVDSLDNVKFYTGKIKSKPDNKSLEYMHKNWFGDHHQLELNHSYIQVFPYQYRLHFQWLFPIREGGLNFSAQPLTKHEAKLFCESKEMQDNIIKSYEMMLDFYGLKLDDKTTGQVSRGDNYVERYSHLNRSFHNYLRITRILKCFGLVGLEQYKLPLIKHFAEEVFEHDQLENCSESLVKYWFPTLRRESELKQMEDYVEKKAGKKISRKYYDDEEPTWANVKLE